MAELEFYAQKLRPSTIALHSPSRFSWLCHRLTLLPCSSPVIGALSHGFTPLPVFGSPVDVNVPVMAVSVVSASPSLSFLLCKFLCKIVGFFSGFVIEIFY